MIVAMLAIIGTATVLFTTYIFTAPVGLTLLEYDPE